MRLPLQLFWFLRSCIHHLRSISSLEAARFSIAAFLAGSGQLRAKVIFRYEAGPSQGLFIQKPQRSRFLFCSLLHFSVRISSLAPIPFSAFSSFFLVYVLYIKYSIHMSNFWFGHILKSSKGFNFLF